MLLLTRVQSLKRGFERLEEPINMLLGLMQLQTRVSGTHALGSQNLVTEMRI
jgi:hypothetical protein